MHTSVLQRGAGVPARSPLPSCPRQSLPTTRQVTCRAKKEAAVGFRWDASNLRWVRDDRYKSELPEDVAVIKPYSGTPYTIWPVVHTELRSIGLKGVSPEQAFQMQKKGWTIVDVRIEGDYEQEHPAGAINVPLYRFTQGNSFWDQVKKIAYFGLAMKPTERDPNYVESALKKLKKGQKIILACAIGGSLDTKLRLRPDKYKDGINDLDRSFGRESRSLKAAYELYKGTQDSWLPWDGWNSSNMVFLDGGVQQWRFQGYPMETTVEVEEEEEN